MIVIEIKTHKNLLTSRRSRQICFGVVLQIDQQWFSAGQSEFLVRKPGR